MNVLQSHLLESTGAVEHAFGTRSSDDRNATMVRQVHGGRVISLERPGDFARASKEQADALLTPVRGRKIAVRTADCVPVLLYAEGSQTKVAGALHVGWRSLAKGLLSKTFAALRSFYDAPPHQCWAAIGPAISRENYSVRSDLVNQFRPFLKGYELREDNYFFSDGDGYLFDIKGLVRATLEREGLPESHIDDLDRCTFEPLFHSHRQDRTEKRMQHSIALR